MHKKTYRLSDEKILDELIRQMWILIGWSKKPAVLLTLDITINRF